MSNNKKKKRRKQQNFSKKKFKNVFCSVCSICGLKPVPTFCYNSLYKANPDIFITKVFPALTDMATYLASKGVSASSMTITDFSSTFCEKGVCTGGEPMKIMSCAGHRQCHDTFTQQIKSAQSSPIIGIYKAGKNKKKKKKKARRVYTPYATSFSRDDEIFQAAVRKILDGDNNKQQDSDQESDNGSSGSTDRKVKGGKSEV